MFILAYHLKPKGDQQILGSQSRIQLEPLSLLLASLLYDIDGRQVTGDVTSSLPHSATGKEGQHTGRRLQVAEA